MEEIKDLIKQEDYEKYKKLLQEFECKAIDIIEDLTYQFKETLAEDVDRKIKGWKDECERLLKENWKKDDRIAELEQELTELKEKMQEEISRREIYFISWLSNKVCKGYVIGYNEEDKFIIICGEDMISTNEIFTYEQEAQEKLKELKGNE